MKLTVSTAHASRTRAPPHLLGPHRRVGLRTPLLGTGVGHHRDRWRPAGADPAERVRPAVTGAAAADGRVRAGGRAAQTVPRRRHRTGAARDHPQRRLGAVAGRPRRRTAGPRPDVGAQRCGARPADSAVAGHRREGGPGAAGAQERPHRLRPLRHCAGAARRRPRRPARRVVANVTGGPAFGADIANSFSGPTSPCWR